MLRIGPETTIRKRKSTPIFYKITTPFFKGGERPKNSSMYSRVGIDAKARILSGEVLAEARALLRGLMVIFMMFLLSLLLLPQSSLVQLPFNSKGSGACSEMCGYSEVSC